MSTSKRWCPVSGPSGVIYTPDRTDSFRGHEPEKPDRNRTNSGQKPDSEKDAILPSPLRCIRLKCLDCCLGSFHEVDLCGAGRHCLLHPYRKGRRPEGMESFSPLRVVRKYCLQCGEENSYSDVEACPMKDCPLFPYRLGSHPGRKLHPLTEEEKQELRERLARIREGKNALQ